MNKSLIALAFIAASAAFAGSPEIAEGTTFEAPPDDADRLIAAGLAKEAEAKSETTRAKSVKARLLMDHHEHGKANDLVTLPADVAKALVAAGLADTSREAVAYAATLDQNKPKPTA